MAFIFTRVLRNRKSVSVYGSKTWREPGGTTKAKQTYLGKIQTPSGAVVLNRRHGDWLAEHGLGLAELEAALRKAADRHGLTLILPESWLLPTAADASGGAPVPEGSDMAGPPPEADLSRDQTQDRSPEHGHARDLCQSPDLNRFQGQDHGIPDPNLGPAQASFRVGVEDPPRPDGCRPEAPAAPSEGLRTAAMEGNGGTPAHEAAPPPVQQETAGPHGSPVAAPDAPAPYSLPPAFAFESRACGHVHLLNHLSVETGLAEALSRAFPESWERLVPLAFFAALEGGPLEGFAAFSKRCMFPAARVRPDTPDESSDLLGMIRRDEVAGFLAVWREMLGETEFEAHVCPAADDGAIDSPELMRIRLCVAFGARSGLPAGVSVLHGDPDSASASVAAARRATGGSPGTIVVSGEGQYSRENLDWFAGRAPEIGFRMRLPETDSAFAGVIMEILTGSPDDQSILASPDGPIIGFSKRVEIEGRELFARAFLDRFAKIRAEDAVLFNALDMLDIATAEPELHADDRLFGEALNFTASGEGRGYAVEMRPDLVQELTFGSGWSVDLLSRDIGLAETIRRRGKASLAERAFARAGSGSRNGGGGGVWGGILVAFAALALLSRVHDLMDEAGLFERYSVKELLDELGTLRALCTSDGPLWAPADPDTLALFTALGCQPPRNPAT
ncbi:MAG: hypothetical protein LBR80_14220 [Deltaproteobacteria bacterium]|jgi:hypothetical protein|nr:hypothetical protein [Deltaproteobacteria bacterium]